MIEHYLDSELSDGRNQTHTLLPEQLGTYKELRILTMATRFKQGVFFDIWIMWL